MSLNKVPSIETLLKTFQIFKESGLIKEDLQFDPEHYIRTVVIPGWNKIIKSSKTSKEHTSENCKFAKNFPKCFDGKCSTCVEWEFRCKS